MFDVFLSHNRQQKPWVRAFARLLRDNGLSVFFDEDSIPPGDSLVRVIEQAIDQSRHVILVLSLASVTSKWVAMETAITVTSDPDASKGTLIPVFLEHVDIDKLRPSLRALNCIDLSDPQSRNDRLKQLLTYLNIPHSVSIYQLPWSDEIIDDRGWTSSGLGVASIDDINSWGWAVPRLISELINIDYDTLDGLTHEHEGSAQQWLPVWEDHPDTGRMIVNAPGGIIGYWHFVPLFKPEFALAKKGQLMDGQITADKIALMELPGRYNMYFITMCMKREFRHTQAVRLLFNSFLRIMTKLARAGVFFTEICANAYTPSGVTVCRAFGLRHTVNHVDRGQIYTRKIFPFPEHDIFREHEELIELYMKEFS